MTQRIINEFIATIMNKAKQEHLLTMLFIPVEHLTTKLRGKTTNLFAVRKTLDVNTNGHQRLVFTDHLKI